MHFSVNVFGSILCMVIMYVLKAFGISILAAEINMVGVAIIHTLFNTINTIILTPIKKLLIRLCEWVVPDREEKTHTVFLDERIFNNVPLALSECRRLTVEMAQHTRNALLTAIGTVDNYDKDKIDAVREAEALTDKYEDKLGTYLVRISSKDLTPDESHSVARMLHSLSDFERITDHALNVCDLAQEIKDKNIIFSDEAKKEISVVTEALKEILDITVDSFINDDVDMASKVEPLEQVIDKLRDRLKARHVDRLQRGECTVQLGFVFSDLLTNYERVSDHCSNIAVYTIQLHTETLDTHKYLRNVKTRAVEEYVNEYNMYEEKYSI